MGDLDGSSVELTDDVLKHLSPTSVVTLTEIHKPYCLDEDRDDETLSTISDGTERVSEYQTQSVPPPPTHDITFTQVPMHTM